MAHEQVMVSRYALMVFEHEAEMDPDSIGEWVRHDDYLALKAALHEALDGWEHGDEDGNEARRVELRKEFLE